MVDPLDRRSFGKPKPAEQHFTGIVKMVRHELNEDCKTLFFDTDLLKRKRAFEELMKMPHRFTSQMRDLSPEQKNALKTALQQDHKKLENALKAIPIQSYMIVDGIHVNVLDKQSNKPFTLYDFFSDPHMLTEKEVTFQYHALKFNSKVLVQAFPGLDDPHLKLEMQKHKKTHKHVVFTFRSIEYDIVPSNPSGSYNITGKCPVKELSHSIKFDIPHGIMPGDLNTSLDHILQEGE